MSSESDGSGRSDDIVVIKQLLQKLEEAAAREAETPREEPQPGDRPALAIVAAELTVVAEASGTEPVSQEPPLLVLRSNRGMAPVNPMPAADGAPALTQGMPEFSRPPMSIDLRPMNDTALAKMPQEALPVRRKQGIVLAGLSFALGIVAAAGLIVVVDPFGQRDPGTNVVRAPSATLSAERARGGGESQNLRAVIESSPAVASADVAASRASPGGAVVVAEAEPAPATGPAGQEAAPAAAAAPSAAAGDRIGLQVASRIELKAGERRFIDVRVDAPLDETQRLLVVFRQVPGWMTFSKGGAIGNDIWLLPAPQVTDLEVEVSEGASGTAEVKVQLAKVDGSILTETSVTLSAAPQAYAPAAAAGVASSGGNEATILRLQARGELLLDTGEVEAARTLLRTAAEAGSVAAALRLAETYDPAESQRLGMADRSADLGQAVRWYEHAQALGSPVAAARLVALGRR